MFTWLRSLASAAAVVELRSDRIRVRDIAGKAAFEFEPLLSIDGSQRVVSIGRPIAASAVKTYAPFASPGALAQDRRIAELLIQYAYSRLGSITWLKPAPRIVLLISADSANDIRRVDDSELIRLSEVAGARVTVVHRGPAVSNSEAERLLDAA
jgi:hypothetical protein